MSLFPRWLPCACVSPLPGTIGAGWVVSLLVSPEVARAGHPGSHSDKNGSRWDHCPHRAVITVAAHDPLSLSDDAGITQILGGLAVVLPPTGLQAQ